MDERVDYFKRRDKIRDALLSNTPKVLTDLGFDQIMLTPAVSNWLKSNSLQLKPEEALRYAEYLNDALHWFTEFQKNKVSTGVAHHLVDTMVEREKQDDPRRFQIKCRSGCSACCYIKVGITEEEGRLLSSFVTDADLPKLERQAEATTIELWSRLPEEDAACVFLEKESGRCKVYEYRPAVCRLAHSLSGPMTCGRKPVGVNKTMIWFRAEAVVAAFISSSKQIGGLANMVLKGLTQSDR